MQVAWYGRDGKHGQDKGLLTIPVEIERENQIGRTVTLKPGINDEIAEADWKKAMEIETIRWYVDQGCLEVIQAETLESFSERDAAQMAKETIDMNLLAKWRRAELGFANPRQNVIAAIDKQLTDMTTLPDAVKKQQEEAKKKTAKPWVK